MDMIKQVQLSYRAAGVLRQDDGEEAFSSLERAVVLVNAS